MAKQEGTDAAGDLRGSRGALFCIPRARLAILRREDDEESGPKETEWKDRGFLHRTVSDLFAHAWDKTTNPSRTADRQRS